ncbi:MAG: hypothetical protein LBS40_03890 [Burkholderiales bacterium]|jgi:hypothetical protein|nr:hypothetical protein [Burkholderiales bacterium]
MSFLVKIIAAAIIAILLIVAAVLFTSKVWMRRQTSKYEAIANLVPPALYHPARIALERSHAIKLSESTKSLWRVYEKMGFMVLADYSEKNNAFANVRLAGHPTLKIGLILIEDNDGQSYSVVLAITTDNQVEARGNGPATDLYSGTIHWVMNKNYLPDQCFEEVRLAVEGKTLLNPDTRLLRAIWASIYASNADAEIASGLCTKEKTMQHVASLISKPDEQIIDEVLEASTTAWRRRMEEAVLDNWRHENRIDDAYWEIVKNRIHVVDNFLEPDMIKNMLSENENADILVDRLDKSGFSGIRLYEEAQRQLPNERRYQSIGEVQHPIYALIYAPVDEPGDRIGEHTDTESDHDIYQERTQSVGVFDTQHVEDIVVTISQLTAQSFAETSGKLLWKSAWIWLLPLSLLIYSFIGSGPTGWINWLIYIYALVAFIFLLFSVIPLFLFHQIMFARLYRQPRKGLLLLNILAKIKPLKIITPIQLLAEKCKFWASMDKTNEALNLWEQQKGTLNDETFYAELAQIHDEAGQFDEQLTALRQLHKVSAESNVSTIDLALALLHYKKTSNEAQMLIDRFQPLQLSGLTLAEYWLCHGLIATLHNRYTDSFEFYEKTIEETRPFVAQNPLALILIAQANGYAALSLLALGKREPAIKLMQSIRPILRLHPSTRIIVKRFANQLARSGPF